eukprot:7314400-Pyramimonas_sp.AAC.1
MMGMIKVPHQVPTSCAQSPMPPKTSQGSRPKGVWGVLGLQAVEAVLADFRAQVGPMAQEVPTRVPCWINGDRLGTIT